ncbi:TonB-dependent receptor [Sphingomonas gilva]|uniref:TonB-dependent receptor n=1 Tax=Sphingomonas gilva TaxID=2305907 RepID=A0A396RV40_9SPHN|nr:TonB-dependent receptor [Sphingomonas gilva]RHW19262.1 TonB-dependent receptor [Sphingomonas gilva]
MAHRFMVPASLLLAGTSAFAQTSPAPADQAAPPATTQPAPLTQEDVAPETTVDPQGVEGDAAPPQEAGIIVTGSRIRGIAPVGSNVIAVGAEQLERQPTATVTDFLRKIPQVQGFGVDASSPTVSGQGGTNTTRGSSINLRGLGPGATLTLLDGQRLPSSGVSGNYIDPNAIPAIAIERVEVVADGASAIYGSDAVAGVVNFITRRDYDGVMVRARGGLAEDYWLAQAGAVVGKRWGTGGFALSYEHTETDNLNGGERSYIRSDLTGLGGNDYRNSQCNPGNIVTGGRSYAIPVGGVTPETAALLIPGTRNYCENLRFGDILPSETRDSFVFNAHQEIAEGLTLNAQVLFSNRSYEAKALQQGSTSNLVNLSVPSRNPYFVAPPGTNPASVTVEYDFTRELGLINQTGYTRDRRFSGGLEWEISQDWEFNISGFYGVDDSAQVTRRIDSGALNAALGSTDPAAAFNPFGGGNSQAVLDSIFVGIFNPYAINRTRGGQVNLSGSLLSLPGGDVRLAVGAEFIRYTIDGGSAMGRIDSPNLLYQKQERNQKSAYGELFIPIFGSGNAVPGFERLDLSIAGRIDDYSDVGSTTNPKFGVNWSPVDGLVLKGSYGQSFRAPNLQDLPLLRTGAGLAVVTWLDPESPTGSSVGLSLNAGNPDLTPEKATTWSGTVEFSPRSTPGLLLSATYFNIDYSDVIGFPPRTANSLLDPNYSFVVTRNPSDELIQSYLDQGFTIAGIRPPVVGFFYNGQARNLGSIQTDGVDFNLLYDIDTDVGEFGLGLNGTYLFNYKVAISPDAPLEQQKSNINFPVDFRARGSVGWSNAGASVEVTVNYLNGYNNVLVSPVQRVESLTTVDFHLGYEFQQDSGLLEGLEISLDGTNFFNERAPFVNIQNGFDPGQASALGRFVNLTVTKKF